MTLTGGLLDEWCAGDFGRAATLGEGTDTTRPDHVGAASSPAPRRNLRCGSENRKRQVHSPLGITGPNPWGTHLRVCTTWGYDCGYSRVTSDQCASDLRE